jgi:hypothetical protein
MTTPDIGLYSKGWVSMPCIWARSKDFPDIVCQKGH